MHLHRHLGQVDQVSVHGERDQSANPPLPWPDLNWAEKVTHPELWLHVHIHPHALTLR